MRRELEGADSSRDVCVEFHERKEGDAPFLSACSQGLYELYGVWVVGVFGEVVAEGDVGVR
ncbi:MAG: hypothetical protein ACO2PN_27890 [Pyrobaculum sp.]|jgi:hypothetical protein